MGLFESIFRKPQQQRATGQYFQTLTGYTPAFTSFEGGVYEADLTRAAIHTFAKQCAKLTPQITGSAYKNLEPVLQNRPNPFMDGYKFVYRLATILKTGNNAFIIPIYDDTLTRVVGFYPALPQNTRVIEYQGRPYMRYQFGGGNWAAIELEKVGILNQYQYKNDFFGESNRAFNPTMQLLNAQNEGIIEGIKQSATIRFLARLAQPLRQEDIAAERKRFTDTNLGKENNGGVLLVDTKYADVKQIESKALIVNPAQKAAIEENVYTYFGTSKAIMQNTFDENQWNAYYEGEIEPFAIQLSLVLSNMLFTPREQSFGNAVYFSANRLQYASNTTKLSVTTQLFDRGMLTQNQALEVWNMPGIGPAGDVYYIRKEYTDQTQLTPSTETPVQPTEAAGNKQPASSGKTPAEGAGAAAGGGMEE
jgi:hypothetical protein